MLISTQALTSPARRASETAMRMTDRTETEEAKAGSIYLRMVAGVHPAGMSETCEALFETMGYGPLRVFFEAPGGEGAFQAYGDAVCAELAAVMRNVAAVVWLPRSRANATPSCALATIA